jgi:hypothetical protein
LYKIGITINPVDFETVLLQPEVLEKYLSYEEAKRLLENYEPALSKEESVYLSPLKALVLRQIVSSSPLAIVPWFFRVLNPGVSKTSHKTRRLEILFGKICFSYSFILFGSGLVGQLGGVLDGTLSLAFWGVATYFFFQFILPFSM